MDYYVDILEPGADLNVAMDNLGRKVAGLYAEAWNTLKKKYYDDKPFDLHIALFADLWFNGGLKIFVAYDRQTNDAIGFLTGVVFRPMQYKATVFQIQEWYTKPGIADQQLIDHVIKSIKILGCDELWVQSYDGRQLPLGNNWKIGGDFSIRRYIKGG